MKENFYHINPDLLVKYLLGESSPEERTLTEQWIDASEANRKQFDDFRLIWETSKSLAAEAPADEDVSWLRFQQRIHAPAVQQAVVRPLHRRLSPLRVAVLLLLLLGAGTIMTFLLSANKTLSLQSGNDVLRDTLPDGSDITLNKNSVITYPQRFTGGTRSIALQGEAFFHITPNKSKPFIIQVNDITVRVVGTSFNVRSRGGHTDVVVETGIVQVSRRQQSVLLTPGQQVSITAGDTVLAQQPVTDKLYNYYRSREFVCDSTPLWKLAGVLEEAYGTPIVIKRKELRNLLITTTFENESLDTVLAIVSKTFNITVEKSANQILLK